MSELTTKESELDKVNWENVLIIKEYQKYLHITDIIELSLLSKLIRQKLKLRLFESIKFNGRQFEKYFNSRDSLILGSFEFIKHYEMYFTVIGFDKSPYTGLKAEDALQELEDDLINVKSSVKSFEFSYTSRIGYYLFPLLYIFDNLTRLKIFDCIIPLAEFCKLLKCLKLENLDIVDSSFTKHPNEELTTEDIRFPNTLKVLSISTCNFCSDSFLLTPQKYLFGKANCNNISDFKFPSAKIPSLVSFALKTIYSGDYGASQFLLNNPQLEHLKIESDHLDQVKFDYISKSKTIKNLELICTTIEHHQIAISTPPPKLESIKELRFYNVSDEIYYILKDINVFFSNLNSLYFIFDEMVFDYSLVTIKNLINNIIPNAPELKLIYLTFLDELCDPIDFSNLNGIEKLIIETNISNIDQIDFSKCESLNELVLNFEDNEYDDDDVDFEVIKDDLNHLEGWKFEHKLGSVKGVRV